ncbi:MAG: YrvL family regulatory protein [Clostridium sp.]|nr:YrvL family regulatory protein [Clostridium sp.]MDU7084505.1 YrvL family regulatory protein [Clostridium sp.]
MKENKKVLSLFFGIAGLAVSFIIFFAISVIIGAGLLNILGFEYTAVSYVVFFFLIYTIAAFFVEPFVEAYVLAVTEMGRLNKFISESIGFIFCVGFDIILISLIETMIDGIMISDRTIVLFAMITYVCGKIFEEILYRDAVEEVVEKKNKKVKKAFGRKKSKSEEE